MDLIVIPLAILAVTWIPLARKFKDGWIKRRNPVSLAICIAMLLFGYFNALIVLLVAGQLSLTFLVIAMTVFQMVAVVNFYMSFWWSEKKFVNTRTTPAKT